MQVPENEGAAVRPPLPTRIGCELRGLLSVGARARSGLGRKARHGALHFGRNRRELLRPRAQLLTETRTDLGLLGQQLSRGLHAERRLGVRNAGLEIIASHGVLEPGEALERSESLLLRLVDRREGIAICVKPARRI